jgi:signal peptidase I
MSGFATPDAQIETAAAEQGLARNVTGQPSAAAAPEETGPPPEQETPTTATEQPKLTDADSWWDLTRILIYAVLIALVERTLLFQPYNIPSGSMEDTLLIGDYVFVEKFSYGYSRHSLPWGRLLPSFGRLWAAEPARGDVAVFTPPAEPEKDYIKRIVGLPGDRVQMLHGVLYINDKPIPKVRVPDYVEDENGYEHHIARYRETMPNGKSYYVLDKDADGLYDTTQVYTVPAGQYFVMGDNRDDSADSRGALGPIPAEYLVGKAELVFWSFDERKAHVWTLWKWPRAIRWGRLFTLID